MRARLQSRRFYCSLTTALVAIAMAAAPQQEAYAQCTADFTQVFLGIPGAGGDVSGAVGGAIGDLELDYVDSESGDAYWTGVGSQGSFIVQINVVLDAQNGVLQVGWKLYYGSFANTIASGDVAYRGGSLSVPIDSDTWTFSSADHSYSATPGLGLPTSDPINWAGTTDVSIDVSGCAP